MAGGVFGGLVLLSSAYHPLLFNSPDLPPDFSKSPLRLTFWLWPPAQTWRKVS